MKKKECEKAIRALCSQYARARGIKMDAASEPIFSDFVSWLRDAGYGQYLEFRSAMGARYDAEMWFDDEFKQNWRN